MSATGAQSPALTYEQFKARKKRREITHPVMTDDDAVTAYKLAEEALKQARLLGTPDEVAAAQAAADAAEAEVRASAVLMRLRALPRKGDGSYAALKAEHPPQVTDHEAAQEATDDPKAKAIWHGDTFEPALVAACLIDPAVTVEQAAELAADMNDAEWNRLVLAAISVNQQATDITGLTFK